MNTQKDTTSTTSTSFWTHNPATGKPLAEYQYHAEEEALDVARSVHHAGRTTWQHTSFEERAQVFKNLASVLRDNKQEYALLMTREMGKVIKESLAEVEKCAWLAEVLAEQGEAWLRDEHLEADGDEHLICFEPLGCIYLIMPWNYPFWQPFKVGLLPLYAGNSILLKHASNVTGSALCIESIMKDAGFPDDVFRTVVVRHGTSNALVESEYVQAVSLTGGNVSGSLVASLAGKCIKKTVLELGGSDPFIVCADADVKLAAAQAVSGRMNNCGQVCIGAKRIIVHSSIYDEFLGYYKEGVASLKQGDPEDPNTDIGPLVNEAALQDMEAFVQDAVEQGAELVIGGNRAADTGSFFAPTIVATKGKALRMVREEVFGPIAPVIEVASDDEAIALANSSEFGLNASVWTTDLNKGKALAAKIEAGGVFINHISSSHPLLPLGGVKQSGYGRELSHWGIKEFVNVKAINVYS